MQVGLKSMLEAGPPEREWEIILVDDGSTDATRDRIASEFLAWDNVRLVQHRENRGLIAALVTGFAEASGGHVACLDADCTYQPLIVNALLEKAASGYDVVSASPYHSDGVVNNVAEWRIALSRTASTIYRRLFSSKLTCYTCLVRVYNREILAGFDPKTSGFVGVTELLWQLDQAGATIAEVPATLNPRETDISKMSTWRTTVRHFGLMVEILRDRLVRHR